MSTEGVDGQKKPKSCQHSLWKSNCRCLQNQYVFWNTDYNKTVLKGLANKCILWG